MNLTVKAKKKEEESGVAILVPVLRRHMTLRLTLSRWRVRFCLPLQFHHWYIHQNITLDQ